MLNGNIYRKHHSLKDMFTNIESTLSLLWCRICYTTVAKQYHLISKALHPHQHPFPSFNFTLLSEGLKYIFDRGNPSQLILTIINEKASSNSRNGSYIDLTTRDNECENRCLFIRTPVIVALRVLHQVQLR